MKLLSQAPHEAGQHHRHNLTLLAAQQTPQGGGQGRSVPAASTAHLPSRAGASEAPPATAGRATMVECPLCDRSIPLTKWNEHLHDPMHARKAKLAAFHQALEEGSRDKFGVNIVQAELDFGVIDVSSLSEWPTREDVFYIRLEEGPIKLEDVRLTSRLSSLSQYRDANFHVRFSAAITLSVGFMYAIKVTFDPKGNRGRYEDRVEFSFELLSNKSKFVITRVIKATVTVEAHWQQLAPIARYVKPKRLPRREKASITDGQKPPNFQRHIGAFRYRLPEFQILQEFKENIQHGSSESKVERIREQNPLGLSWDTYSEYFRALLWLEELQAHKDMENYDQTAVQFVRQFGKHFLLEVPGLAERRPSVLIGDSVVVRPTKSTSNTWFRGYVHGVQQSHVMLGFYRQFTSPHGQEIDVEFELNRLMFRRMHMARATSFSRRAILFPNPQDIVTYKLSPPSLQDQSSMSIFDARVAANGPQKLAVTAIKHLPAGSIPFIIFGPPGTGKTVTVVEAIRQILTEHPTAKILACAPSNNAADIIADRLRETLSPEQLFRLNAPSRYKDLPRSLESYSLRYDDGSFGIPKVKSLINYRVVVSTCASGSLLHGVGVTSGHFTHIFVDEAGQASEPEVMIPIKMNAGLQTIVVLAGDPKQLGPVIRSPVARRLGLDVSYLDRLMSMDMYGTVSNRGITYVKLIKNWRSHRAIIDFPNQQFYAGELEACADRATSDRCLGWDKLPKQDYPVIFHALKGQDLRESRSPSWFNAEEASAVSDYVRDLRHDPRTRFEEDQIGVITPYRAQVRKVRTVLHTDFPEVKVGTTEEFQGDERHAIIVSTVRSSLDFVEFDLRHTLGFVANPRRFNVAMTRAKSVLIVIGDPDVLGLDPLWRRFLNHVHAHGGWKGVRIPWDPDEEVLTDAAGGDRLAYDVKMRAHAEQDLQSLVARTSAFGLDALDEEEELEADADLHWHADD